MPYFRRRSEPFEAEPYDGSVESLCCVVSLLARTNPGMIRLNIQAQDKTDGSRWLVEVEPDNNHIPGGRSTKFDLRAGKVLVACGGRVEVQDAEQFAKWAEPNRHAPIGFCPQCGTPGQFRYPREGNDACWRGHIYPSHESLPEPR